MTYAEKLKDPRWQKIRLKIFERDNWQCCKCSDKEQTLHVHHLKYHGNPWDAPIENLITLCSECHTIIESIFEYNNETTTVLKLKNKHYGNVIIFKIGNVMTYWRVNNTAELIFSIEIGSISDNQITNLKNTLPNG